MGNHSANTRLLQVAVVVLLLLSPAGGETAADDRALLPGGDAPDAVLSTTALQRPGREPLPAWLVRTGFKKGVYDAVLDDERAAGPDVAVLRAGFFSAWPDLLAPAEEPWVFVGHDDLALLSRRQPVLIIPTGGLYGTGRSVFFRAALAEYVLSGGTLICFSQQKGEDFASLPLPGGSILEAAGWAEDAGPLFRASVIQAAHPAVAGLRSATPSVHTAGRFITLPANAEAVLARPDGFSVLAVYPLGKGRVVLSALYPDAASTGGYLADDEQTILRGLIAWAKSPASLTAAPGERVTLPLTVAGPEHGSAESLRLVITRAGGDRVLAEQVLNIPVPPGGRVSVPFAFTVPVGAPAGLYRTEYELLDGTGKPLSPRVEASEGGLVVGRAPAARPLNRSPKPLAAFPAPLTLSASAPPPPASGRTITVTLTITAPETVPAGQTFVAAVGDREQFFQLSDNKADLVMELPLPAAGTSIPCSVRHTNGRLLARSVLTVGERAGADIVLDRHVYAPGDRAMIRHPGLSAGELTVTGLGTTHRSMVRRGEPISITVPALPPGTYPLSWQFVGLDGTVRSGEIPVVVGGAGPVFRGASVQPEESGKARRLSLSLALTSPSPVAGVIDLALKRPDGSLEQLDRVFVELAAGPQNIPAAVSVVPKTAGLHELRYTLSLPLPAGAGLEQESVVVAAGRELIDIGDIAVLGTGPVKTVHYEASGPAAITTVVYSGGGRRTIETFANGRRVGKQKIDQAGTVVLTTEVTGLMPGPTVLRVRADGDRLDSIREHSFLWGARLADLVAKIGLPEPRTAVLPVTVTVSNRGKSGSPPVSVEVYEIEEGRRRAPIGSARIPSLLPGASQSVEIPWSLVKRTGARTVAAEVDPANTVPDADRRNNLTTASLIVPDLLVSAQPSSRETASDAPFSVTLSTVNLTTASLPSTVATISLSGPSGERLTGETVALPVLEPGAQHTVRKDLALKTLLPGLYTVHASVLGAATPVSTSASFTVLPTLALRGSLDGTPDRASSCRPLSISYAVENSGNVPPTAGSLTIELLSPSGSPAFARRLPLAFAPSSVTIDSLAAPPGMYTARLSVSAVNEQLGLSREGVLAQHPVLVEGPVKARRFGQPIPRILLWKGADRNTVERAVQSAVIKQAFGEEAVFLRVVDQASEFRLQAERGLFNVFVLFEIDTAPDSWEWLAALLAGGRTLLIIGETEETRKAAEAFGFTFGDALPARQHRVVLTGTASLDLGGTLPVQGRILHPRKKGAETVAVVEGSGRPAALVDRRGNSAVGVLPFSFITSARFSAAAELYGLALRSAVRSLTPEREEGTTAIAEGVIISAPSGSVTARITAVLPAGSRPLWTGEGGVASGTTVTFDVTAGGQEQVLLHLYEPPADRRDSPRYTISYECKGSFVSQGSLP